MSAAAPPNVLFIAVDDLRPFLGCYGDANAHTPHIDALAARGVTFTNAMCTAPACGPSRAALLSGLLPTQTGVYGFQDWAGRESFESIVTMPEYFRQHGYRTFGSGKIHHNSLRVASYTQQAVDINRAEAEPDVAVMVPRADREWDVNNIAAVRESRYHHDPCMADGFDWSGGSGEGPPNSVKLVSGPSDDPVMDCYDGVTAQFGVDVLRQQHDEPFFLATGFVRPHLPFIAPRQYFEHYPLGDLQLHPVKYDDLADSPWAARRNARVRDDINIRTADPEHGRRRVIQSYYACVSFLDDMVGKVLDELARSPYADNTVVIFWSDHGWHLGEKRSWRKFSLWEESARTPMIIADPRRLQTAGQQCARPVGLIDVYPSLTDLCGLPTPEHLDGVPLTGLVDAPEADSPALRTPELTVHGRSNYSLRDERWRYTRYFDGSEELYDHQADHYEWENLASDEGYRDLLDHFRALLPADSVPSCGPPGNVASAADQDKDDMEQFRTEVWPDWLARAVPPLL
jgi:arylsulfatase A-like enzyme